MAASNDGALIGRTASGTSVVATNLENGLERTVTEGIVSTKTRQVQGALYLQTDDGKFCAKRDVIHSRMGGLEIWQVKGEDGLR